MTIPEALITGGTVVATAFALLYAIWNRKNWAPLDDDRTDLAHLWWNHGLNAAESYRPRRRR